MATTARLKRLLIGRAIRTEQGTRTDGRPRAIATMASDALSSNAYATQEILVILAAGGFGLYAFGPWIAAAVVVVFAVVVAGYRHVVRQYPGGGADYEVAARNLGSGPAALVGSAMLIDFALTLAVSVAAMLDTLVSLFPQTWDNRVPIGVAIVMVMTLLSLRGPSGLQSVLRLGTYSFVLAILAMTVVAAIRVAAGDAPTADSAGFELADAGAPAVGLGLGLLLARSFSSGTIAVTGVEAIGTGVPDFRKPRGDNAAAALAILGVVSMILFIGITWLALLTGVRVVADPGALAGEPAGQVQRTVIVQIADAVLGSGLGVGLVAAATMLILLAAGLSAFRSFTALSSVIARDGMLPRAFNVRGDRFVYSNGIILLGVAAGLLLWALAASLTALIQLYVVGVFLALALGQAGMVRHWTAVLHSATGPEGRQARRARLLAGTAAALSVLVLAVVLSSKLTSGAWVVVLLIPLLAAAMLAVRRHYEAVAYDLAPRFATEGPASHQVTALILVSRIHKPTLRAIAYARASRPTRLEAITVAVDDREAARLQQEWADRAFPVPLQVLESPFREIEGPILAYVGQLRAESPEGLLTVYVPEYVVTHWWEELLHNQSAARLKRRLMSLPNVVVVSVPWQMAGTGPGAVSDGGPRTGGVTGVTEALPRIDPNRPPA